MPLTLSFFGAAGTVTGSRYVLEQDGRRILVDCGLFQGLKALRLRNWAPFPVDPGSIDAVLLTHAHLDHSGYLPALVRDGFRGHIWCSEATRDLCEILLPDSAHLQEQDAEFANRHHFSKHHPALPLYDHHAVEKTLPRFRTVAFDEPRAIAGADVRFRPAGHILGAASLAVEWDGVKIVFSGDLGRYDDPVMRDPAPPAEADYIVVESTYGDRAHGQTDPQDALAEIIGRTIARGGTVVIPTFAVGRAQALLFHLSRLRAQGRLNHAPVFLDSPMAIDVTELAQRQMTQQRLTEAECRAACAVADYVRTREASQALTASPMPKIILSASGMATGGRVLHHLKRFAPDPRNTILFAGFQAAGTRGAAMLAGADSVKIHGHYVPVRAEVAHLDMLSAHADADEILRWLKLAPRPPKRVFVTHGEPVAADTLRRRIQDELGWDTHTPEQAEQVRLSGSRNPA